MVTIDKRQLDDGSVHVTVAGKIDEKFDGAQIVEAARSHKVVMHLAGVRSISSLGVRAFEDFVSAMQGGDVVLIHLSPALANQIAMIPSLCATARIESAKLPFVCPSCGAEKAHSVPWRPNAHKDSAPACACGTTMELDGVPEQYLPVAS